MLIYALLALVGLHLLVIVAEENIFRRNYPVSYAGQSAYGL
jgi:hypothetical protein